MLLALKGLNYTSTEILLEDSLKKMHPKIYIPLHEQKWHIGFGAHNLLRILS
jgi:hypothetical protein